MGVGNRRGSETIAALIGIAIDMTVFLKNEMDD
jgi:hypothetical protein